MTTRYADLPLHIQKDVELGWLLGCQYLHNEIQAPPWEPEADLDALRERLDWVESISHYLDGFRRNYPRFIRNETLADAENLAQNFHDAYAREVQKANPGAKLDLWGETSEKFTSELRIWLMGIAIILVRDRYLMDTLPSMAPWGPDFVVRQEV